MKTAMIALANMVSVAFTSETDWVLDCAVTKAEFAEACPGIKVGETFKAIYPDGSVRVVVVFTDSTWGNHVRFDVQSEQDWQREQDAEAFRASQGLDCYGCGGATPSTGCCSNPNCGG